MVRRIALVAAMALALVWTGAARAAEHPDQYNIPWQWTPKELKKVKSIEKRLKQNNKGFWVKEGKDYLVQSNISPRFTAELVLYMDYFSNVFPKVFPTPPAGKMLTKLHVTVYKTRMEYSVATMAPPWSGGVHWVDFYDYGWPKLYVATFPWNLEKGKEPNFCENFNRGTLQHEGTHALFRKWSGRAILPVFINEGCATYFETWDLRTKTPTQKERGERSMRGFHMEALVRKLADEPDFKPSLHEYVYMDDMQWGMGDIPLHYGLAESFADYMLTDSRRRRTFRNMIERIYKRRMEKAVILTDKEIDKLEPGWHKHIRMLAGGLAKKIEARDKELAAAQPKAPVSSGETTGARREEGGSSGTASGMTKSSGVTGWGAQITLMLPNGIKIAPEEFKQCKTPNDLHKLIMKKLTASR